MKGLSKIFTLVLAMLAMVGLGCNLLSTPRARPTPAPIESVPVGMFDCSATENGMLVGIARFTIQQDGTIRQDGPTTASGTWKYFGAQKAFTFTGPLLVDRATYDPQKKSITFHFLERPQHAESQDVVCYPVSQ